MLSPKLSRGRSAAVLLWLIWLCSTSAHAQQPFITDDADVTPKGKFHFEFSNEFDLLQRSSFPTLKQNTADFELDYGLFRHVEIGIAGPWLTIINDGSAGLRTVSGPGDMNLSVKYNFLREREGKRHPAMAITLNFEIPTGNKERQLGSGLADFYVNTIVQKSLSPRTKWRANGGFVFSVNETTGALGVKARGLVLTTGSSLTRQFTSKLNLGIEMNGALARNADLGKGHLQIMAGGNYNLTRKMTFDFGVVAGRFRASPRLGVQVGVSIDF